VTRPSLNTISLDPLVVEIPLGAGRTHYAARIAAALKGERKPPKPRKPTLASAARAAAKAGIAVARYEVKPDGTNAVVVGEPELADADNPWPTIDQRKKK